MASISVVMVSYHTGNVLFHAIERTLEQPGLKELVLVNNGNPAKVLKRLKDLAKEEKRLILITDHGNVGFSKGCNLGIKKATGEFLVLMNPDCLPEKGALQRLAEGLSKTPEAMLAGPLLLNPDGTEQRGGRRELLTPETAIGESFGLYRFSKKFSRLNKHETETPQKITEVPAISGACMCIRMQDYHAVEGLDEGYFLHVEDLDFCYRIHEARGKTIFVPDARIVHLLSTSKTTSAFIEWHKARGFIRYFRKHFRTRMSWWQGMLLPMAVFIRMGLKLFIAMFNRYPKKSYAAVSGHKMLLLMNTMDRKSAYSSLKGKHFVVTGATSAVGLILIGRMITSGAHVTAYSRRPATPLEVENLRWLQADMNDEDFQLQEGTDAVFHCAPLWALPNAIRAIKHANIGRLIAFGSTSIYGKAASGNKKEQKIVKQLKEAEQQIVAQCGDMHIKYTVLRPTMIYGTGLDGNVSRIARFIRRWHFFPIVPPARGLRQPVHADDLAEAAIQAFAHEESEDMMYNLSGGENISYRDMITRIFHTLGRTPVLLPMPLLPVLLDIVGFISFKSHVNGAMAQRMNEDLVFSHEDATLDFGYTPRTFLPAGLADIDGEVL